MSFDVDLYLYMSWKDPTLHHPGHDFIMINDDSVRKELWTPDLYFANARKSYFHHVTVPNFNLFVAPDGTISYSSRITANVACNLDLVDYPMDAQVCHIRMLSYAYIADRVSVTWFKENPVLMNPEIELPAFTISNLTSEYCNGTYRYAVTDVSHKRDKFSCLDGRFYLKRALGYHIVQSYIPTALIVIISWVSFWIDRRAVPARVTLSFTTLLTLSTIGNGLRYALPQVSYAKAIDYWFGACMVFVFLALIEFAIVNNYMRKSEKFEKLSSKYSAEKEEIIKLPFYQHSHQEMLKLRQQSKMFNSLIGDSPTSARRRFMTRLRSFSLRGGDSESEECYTPISDSDTVSSDGLTKKDATNPDETQILPNGPDQLDSDGNPIVNPEKDEEEPAFITITKKEPDPLKRDVVPNESLSIQYLEVALLMSRRALNIDRASRYIFPIAFLIFNLIYWFYYLIIKAK
uniref:Uncharacterized protein n=1 Tax=Acrobeloides nanus TaxID=290746 RepID=A0A914DUN0_9BILA